MKAQIIVNMSKELKDDVIKIAQEKEIGYSTYCRMIIQEEINRLKENGIVEIKK